MTHGEMVTLFNQAYQAGHEAMSNTTPTPIVIGQATSVLSDQIDYTKPTYYNSMGVCGFAWVKVKNGRTRFAKWLISTGRGRKGYTGGVDIWVNEGNQSFELKEAFAQAFAKELRDNGGIEAYAESRLD